MFMHHKLCLLALVVAAAVRVQRAGRVRRFEQMTGQHFFQLFAVAFITGMSWLLCSS
jgi:hypothetical protein